MKYLLIIIALLFVAVIKRLLDVNSLWIKVKKNEGVLKTKSKLAKDYQFIKNLY